MHMLSSRFPILSPATIIGGTLLGALFWLSGGAGVFLLALAFWVFVGMMMIGPKPRAILSVGLVVAFFWLPYLIFGTVIPGKKTSGFPTFLTLEFLIVSVFFGLLRVYGTAHGNPGSPGAGVGSVGAGIDLGGSAGCSSDSGGGGYSGGGDCGGNG
jgi:hypothetical protein